LTSPHPATPRGARHRILKRSGAGKGAAKQDPRRDFARKVEPRVDAFHHSAALAPGGPWKLNRPGAWLRSGTVLVSIISESAGGGHSRRVR
jgi:hypothetical protein